MYYETKNMLELQHKISQIPNINLDIERLKSTVSYFHSALLFRKRKHYDSITRLLRARTALDNSIIILKNHFDPDKNEYIYETNKKYQSYDALKYNLGIALGMVDVYQKEFDEIKRASEIMQNPTTPIKLEGFRQILIGYM